MSNKKLLKKQLVKLLRTISKDGSVIVGNQDGKYEVYTKECTIPVLKPQPKLVKKCLKEGLIEKNSDGLTLTDGGRFALKRMLAGAEPFSEQHQIRTYRKKLIDGDNRTVLVNDKASPLGWLYRRKDADGKSLISPTQFKAGERLAQDFQFAGAMTITTSSWSDVPSSRRQKKSSPGCVDMTDNQLAARQRLRRALTEVGGELADILLDICCFQTGLVNAEKARKWPRRSGKIILTIALDRLADHYGMKNISNLHPSHSRISHWGSDDYRPSMK